MLTFNPPLYLRYKLNFSTNTLAAGLYRCQSQSVGLLLWFWLTNLDNYHQLSDVSAVHRASQSCEHGSRRLVLFFYLFYLLILYHYIVFLCVFCSLVMYKLTDFLHLYASVWGKAQKKTFYSNKNISNWIHWIVTTYRIFLSGHLHKNSRLLTEVWVMLSIGELMALWCSGISHII